MKNILLVCGAGMSTSLLVKKMQEADKNHQYNIRCSDTLGAQLIMKQSDIFLLAPHISYMKSEFLPLCQKGDIPFMIIDSLDYTKMDGRSVLQKVTEMLKEKEVLKPFQVVLVHSQGGAMSDLLVLDMKKKRNYQEQDWLIESCTIEEFEESGEGDIILLEPQMSYEVDNMKKKLGNSILINVPPRSLYATFDSRKILDYIHEIIRKKE